MASAILVTPKGPAEWVKLFTFDTKFNPLGLYTINLKLKEDEAEDLTVRLTQQVDAVYASELKKNPKLKTKMVKRLPFESVLDDDGEETGLVEFKFKMKARVEMKNGDSFTQKPAVYDAKGKPITEAINIPYMLASTKEASVSLRLKSVQIVELNEYSNDSNPFDTEEGYEFEKDESPFAEAEETSSKGVFSEDEDEDF